VTNLKLPGPLRSLPRLDPLFPHPFRRLAPLLEVLRHWHRLLARFFALGMPFWAGWIGNFGQAAQQQKAKQQNVLHASFLLFSSFLKKGGEIFKTKEEKKKVASEP